MAFVDFAEADANANPVDIIEATAALHDWSFERSAQDEITICVDGRWSDYNISFSWMGELEALHLACGFELSSRPERQSEVLRLLAMVNEQLWSGHFEWWDAQGTVLYRHAMPLNGGAALSTKQIESMLHSALTACEKYYQAFQYVIWAGEDAKNALACAMFQTEGEA